MSSSGDSGRFDAIRGEPTDPPSHPDKKTKQEERRYTPTQQLQADHEALVNRLDTELKELKQQNQVLERRCADLQGQNRELPRLREAESWQTLAKLMSGVCVAAGGAALGFGSERWFLGGWALLLVAVLLNLSPFGAIVTRRMLRFLKDEHH